MGLHPKRAKMKKSITLMSALLVAFCNTIAQNLNFTVTNHTGSWTITCATPSIQLSASSDFTSAVSYAWGGPIFPTTGSMVVLTVPGIYTVSAFGTNSATASQTFAIGVNTTAPSSALSPTFQTINCSVAAQGVTLNATSPTTGVTHQVSSPLGGTAVANGSAFIYVPVSPGTYTYCLTDNSNGCTTCKNFTVTSNYGFPTFSLTSAPAGFSLGCSTKSCMVVNFVNAQTTPPGGPVSYTLLAPGSGSVIAGGPLSQMSTYTVCSPGTWTAITKDNVNQCATRVPFTILQNTQSPVFSVNVPAQVLICNPPQLTLTATSASSGLFLWNYPGTPGAQQGSAITVTSAGAYTLTIRDVNNDCVSTTVIPITDNRVYPIVNSPLDPSPVCLNGGYATLSPIVSSSTAQLTYSWTAPPSATVIGLNTPTLTTNAAGIYTIAVTNTVNGCMTQDTMQVSLCLDLEQGEIPEPVTLFPNPSSGTLMLRTGGKPAKVIVYNMLGVIVREFPSVKGGAQVDISAEPAGLYLVSVLQEGHTRVFRVVKN
jgi:hypothetical protein